MLFASLLLFASTAGIVAPDSAPRPRPVPRTIPELTAAIQKLLDSTKTPGAGLAIVRHDSVLFTGGIGRARVAPAVPASEATLFRIGSTSKQFVALVALELQREGKLSLQDPLASRLPGFWFRNAWEQTDPVRIINLLEHTSGFDDNSLMSYANSDPTPLALAAGLTLDSATRVSRWRPGTRFSYCNTGPAIVARIIETIEKKPFEQIVQERLFTPIGMTTATYFRPDSNKQSVATLYKADGTTPVPYWHVFIRPAGSINGSALDMAAHLRFMLGRGTVDGREIAPREIFAQLESAESPLSHRAGLTLGYGKHIYRLTDSTGFIWTGHDGAVDGGLSGFSYIPELGVGYAFQINSGSSAAFKGVTSLVRAFLMQGIAPPPQPPRALVPASVQALYSGWYRGVSPRTQHLYFLEYLFSLSRVTVSDSALTVSPVFESATTAIAVDSLRFRLRGAPVASFALVPASLNNGTIGLESVESLGASMERVNTGISLTQIVLFFLWMIGSVLAVVAMVFGGIRALVRRVRHKESARAPAANAWRWAALLVALLGMKVGMLTIAASDVNTIGRFGPVTAIAWAAGILFAVLTLVGLVPAVRSTAATTRWQRVSMVAARGTLLLQVLAAGFLVLQGFVGWRTWA